MVKTEGLHHLHLTVRDLERSVRFYRTVFGMEERFREGPHMVFLSTPGSNDLITLNADPAERENAGRSGGIAHFGFRLHRSTPSMPRCAKWSRRAARSRAAASTRPAFLSPT